MTEVMDVLLDDDDMLVGRVMDVKNSSSVSGTVCFRATHGA
jgi:hypothetical protein